MISSAASTRYRSRSAALMLSGHSFTGSSQGPRMGSFIALYGIDNSRRLIEEALTAAA